MKITIPEITGKYCSETCDIDISGVEVILYDDGDIEIYYDTDSYRNNAYFTAAQLRELADASDKLVAIRKESK